MLYYLLVNLYLYLLGNKITKFICFSVLFQILIFLYSLKIIYAAVKSKLTHVQDNAFIKARISGIGRISLFSWLVSKKSAS